jgi:hypothetical protein
VIEDAHPGRVSEFLIVALAERAIQYRPRNIR